MGGASYASWAFPRDPGIHRARGGAARESGGKVSEREIGSQGDALLLDEFVINLFPDLSVPDISSRTKDDYHIFGHIRFDRDSLEGHRARGHHGDRADRWLGNILCVRGGMGGGWGGGCPREVELFWRAVLEWLGELA